MAPPGPRLLALLAVAALGGGAGVAAGGGGATAEARKSAPRAKAKARARARAVKVGAGRGWVPPGALGAQRPPLTASGGAPAGGAGALAAGATPGTGGATTPATTAPATTPPPTVQAVGVTVDERTGYTMLLSRQAIAAGATVVQLLNQGEDEHNLRVVPTGDAGEVIDFPLAAPHGGTATRTLTLAPGAYYLFCTLTTPVNHASEGMSATLTVTAPTG